MSDHIQHQAQGLPFPGEPQRREPKGEAKNDGLAVMALLFGWTFFPVGLLFGHLSNKAAKRANRRRSVLSIIGLVGAYFWTFAVVLFIIAGIAGGAQGSPTVAPTVITPSTAAPLAPVTPKAAPATTAPASPAPAPASKAPAAPAISASQQQALDSAKSYLSDGQGFSRDGLIKQLSSAYGEKFSTADATWAVDHSGADWKAQAVLSAKSYMADGQGFSRSGLIDQLTSQYGEGFTYAQASYAATTVGL